MPYDITYTWIPKYDTSELIQKTETASQTPENKLTVTKGKVGLGRDKSEFGINI